MRYVMVLLLICFGCASSAWGAVAFVAPEVTDGIVSANDEVLVVLRSDQTNVFGMQFDVLTSKSGTASNPQKSDDWDIAYEGNPVNRGGTLLQYIQAALIPDLSNMSPAIGGDLMWFTYTVPDLPHSSTITISAGLYGGWDRIYVATLVNKRRIDLIPTDLVFTVNPEPCSLLLLTLGGVAFISRKRHR